MWTFGALSMFSMSSPLLCAFLFQFSIAADGGAGCALEHSRMDGVSSVVLTNYCLSYWRYVLGLQPLLHGLLCTRPVSLARMPRGSVPALACLHWTSRFCRMAHPCVGHVFLSDGSLYFLCLALFLCSSFYSPGSFFLFDWSWWLLHNNSEISESGLCTRSQL